MLYIKNRKFGYCRFCGRFHFMRYKYQNAPIVVDGQEYPAYERLLYCPKSNATFLPSWLREENEIHINQLANEILNLKLRQDH